MYSNQRRVRQPIGFGGGGKPPKDLLVLLGILLFTYTLSSFATTSVIARLCLLSPDLWQLGYVWQLATYPFIALPGQGLWFIITMLIIFWFGRDVHRVLGQKHFWRLLAWGILTASTAAVAVQLLMSWAGFMPREPFILMQGPSMLLTILIAGFATLFGNATIYFFFVLPVRARWFLGLEILIAFLSFLSTKDLAGFVGICVAVGTTYSMLTSGSLFKMLKELRLRLERRILEIKLRRSRSRFRVVRDDDDDDVHRGPWVN